MQDNDGPLLHVEWINAGTPDVSTIDSGII